MLEMFSSKTFFLKRTTPLNVKIQFNMEVQNTGSEQMADESQHLTKSKGKCPSSCVKKRCLLYLIRKKCSTRVNAK